MSTEEVRRWYIADAYMPTGESASFNSHEAICLLNPTGEDAEFRITAYFADAEPRRSSPLTLAANRSWHLATDRIDGLELAPGVPYALEVESCASLQVQYTRVDVTQPTYALMTTILDPR